MLLSPEYYDRTYLLAAFHKEISTVLLHQEYKLKQSVKHQFSYDAEQYFFALNSELFLNAAICY